MDVADFESWLGWIAVLTVPQRRRAWQALTLSEVSESHDDETGASMDLAIATVDLPAPGERPIAVPLPPLPPSNPIGTEGVAELGQRRVDSVGCPHCEGRDVVRWGRASALPRYRCKTCRRTFNALTKTPLAHLRLKDKWATQTKAMIDGVSTAKAAKRCGVHYTTAFRWRHRFLEALAGDKPQALSGIVEGDETFILESFKGKRSAMPRAARKRGGKPAKCGISAEQIPVLVARDRHGATTDAVLPKLNRLSITAALGGIVTPANEFCCDGGTAIIAFARKAGIPTHILPMPGKPKPNAPDFHINNVNAYHGRLKEWLRRFHGVATKNLPNYLGWRRTLEALGQHATPEALILGAIGLGPYQQATL
ncbi:IS1595 family transposase [Acidiphilium sp. AL]|uniref:IS1595 family transposase n=1 Tax=Acidiphilium iwatense TaxID=768198 RepID=A0ABS9DXI3_9PROT|nr:MULTISPECIES: IS1595 family transposase [Acidiphilium]MCF3946406.1 IS1595 family transposase [Acidiphilium iwatense]MCU4158582.1 IS1595 family transposase [Acidiphilium sp. AL]